MIGTNDNKAHKRAMISTGNWRQSIVARVFRVLGLLGLLSLGLMSCETMPELRKPDVWPSDETHFVSLFKGNARGSAEYRLYPDEILVMVNRVAGERYPEKRGSELEEGAFAAARQYFQTHPINASPEVICPGQGTMHVSYREGAVETIYASSCPNSALFNMHDQMYNLIMQFEKFK